MKTNDQKKQGIPLLDEMAGEWMSNDELAHFPTLHNFHGALQVNKDLASVSWLVNVPFSQGYHSGGLYINDVIHEADEFKWSPYQALRRKKLDNIMVESSTRMVFENKGVLFQIKFKNIGQKVEELNIKTDLVGVISKFKSPLDWDWFYRLPGYPEDNGSRSTAFTAINDTEKEREQIEPVKNGDLNFESAILDDEIFISSDKETQAYTAFSFYNKPDTLVINNQFSGQAEWNIVIQPENSVSIEFVMAFGDDKNCVIQNAKDWSNDFYAAFEEAKTLWQKRFEDAFTPNNGHFSGSLPVLETDDIKLNKMYYMGVITLLMLHRTNLPIMDRVYLTGGPRLGASIMFCWDTSMWSTVFALLDPLMMKKFIKNMLKLDIDSYFGQDMFGGRGVGNMYSATRMNIFKMLYTYVSVTGDTDFLNEKIFSLSVGTYAEMHGDDAVCLDENIGEITILQEMENIATAWKKQVREGDVLADYGEAVNLLECVPTYIHRVPSFNAANVWMMRLTAELYEFDGNNEKAELLKIESGKLSKAVLDLYMPGEGVWCSLHRDGEKVEMRHCFDYISISKFMTSDLTNEMKKEMMEFVESELLTATWMRAQSLKDPAAASSDRADHGPMGAYDGWPAQTIDVMGIFGYWEKALDYMHSCEAVTKEGNFSQARELYGANKDNFNADVRIANRDLVNRECSGGVAFANTVLQLFFGFNPSPFNDNNVLVDSNKNRGFEGNLSNLFYNGNYYEIISDEDGLHIERK